MAIAKVDLLVVRVFNKIFSVPQHVLVRVRPQSRQCSGLTLPCCARTTMTRTIPRFIFEVSTTLHTRSYIRTFCSLSLPSLCVTFSASSSFIWRPMVSVCLRWAHPPCDHAWIGCRRGDVWQPYVVIFVIVSTFCSSVVRSNRGSLHLGLLPYGRRFSKLLSSLVLVLFGSSSWRWWCYLSSFVFVVEPFCPSLISLTLSIPLPWQMLDIRLHRARVLWTAAFVFWHGVFSSWLSTCALYISQS